MSSRSRNELVERAPAKVNLTLRVTGRRRDGYHTIESLVVFASVADQLRLVPGGKLGLTVRGPFRTAAGAVADNLVLHAANALAKEVPGLRLGRFTLTKNVPVAAGLGGGSADAAAALRLLARANRMALDDRRLMKAARKLGADVPVCLDPRPRLMRGIGDVLSAPQKPRRLHAVLINPGVALATGKVFARFDRSNAKRRRRRGPRKPPATFTALLRYLTASDNDLELAAIALAPKIATALETLRAWPGCRLARMTGSGAACFGLFASRRTAAAAARNLAARHRGWWVRAVVLG